MTLYKCCYCGEVIPARKEQVVLRQCSACRSTAILPMSDFKNLVAHVKALNPIYYPTLEAFFNLLIDQGLLSRKRFRKKMVIMQRILEEDPEDG